MPDVDITSIITDVITGRSLGTPSAGVLTNCTGLTASGLANNAVTTAKILDANVTTAKILNANVTTVKIADANVTTAKIADANVTTVKIADANVTTVKIADANVTFAKLAGALVVTEAETILANDNDITVPTSAAVNDLIQKQSEEFIVSLTSATGDAVLANAVEQFLMPFAFTLTSVELYARTAPTGSTLIVDINEDGVSLLSTKLSIDATENSSRTAVTPAVISDSAIASGAIVSFDFDQIGSTISGAGVKVYLRGTRA